VIGKCNFHIFARFEATESITELFSNVVGSIAVDIFPFGFYHQHFVKAINYACACKFWHIVANGSISPFFLLLFGSNCVGGTIIRQFACILAIRMHSPSPVHLQHAYDFKEVGAISSISAHPHHICTLSSSQLVQFSLARHIAFRVACHLMHSGHCSLPHAFLFRFLILWNSPGTSRLVRHNWHSLRLRIGIP